MPSDLQSILWDDLTKAQSRIDRALSALRSLEQAIQAGSVDQPTHQDSQRLNRLMVLADLLYAEIHPWTHELTSPRNNGLRPASAD